ncbi:hypothetical protein DCS_07328 [Drechmeria coniospora]|uniref:Uncharacterized protein n=1 Tax=Drechmeria coniospora TaxID=98403 RepID=A0A151GE50_DRECN|nr:hypothetical protein DCS_07328 [Drechmeria coniospora]KYK55365.1 hypothetical protein DCS_07328 [Drechmeria coniospora]
MSEKRALLGRPLPRFGSRPTTLLLVGLTILALTLIRVISTTLTSPHRGAHDDNVSARRIGGSLSKMGVNPFRQPAHPPPSQENDKHQGSWWWADWKWFSVPFSSSLTLHPDRALLPHLPVRQPIYCYYDGTAQRAPGEEDAERALLRTWQRAWWAQGFRPVILGVAEAMKNPTYEHLQRLEMADEVKLDLTRWLAWETMGGGVLAHYTLLPTVPAGDSLLSYLRRGLYPDLTRWKDLGDALFVGEREDIQAALRAMTEPASLPLLGGGLAGAPDGLFKIDEAATPLAWYSPRAIAKKYSKVAESFERNRAEGLQSLDTLINTHLHVAWQNRFPDGVDVLKPHPEHTTTMIANALKLGRELALCPDSPMPGSCPPNMPRCTPCVARRPMQVSTPERFHNVSAIFTIAVVPHPWTLALVSNLRESLDVSWIRRESPRDSWITTVTRGLLGTGLSAGRRVMILKQIVVDERLPARSLWLTAENDMADDMDWYFGFAIPQQGMDKGESQSPVPGHRLLKKEDEMPDRIDGPVATPEELVKEPPLLERAKAVVALTKSTGETKLRASMEAWNMADSELWRFVRAFEARRALERSEWEKGEAEYSTGAGPERGHSAWSRWYDRGNTAA